MAYFLGLLIGGGKIIGNSISIEFPYKQWPHEDFRIAPTWFNDSVIKIAPLIRDLLGTDARPRYVSVETPRFYIEIEQIPRVLYENLSIYGIKPLGELRRHASIRTLVSEMNRDNRKSFVSGLADVIGSCRRSHRHRTECSSIISFEIIGENWRLPYELCQLLHSLQIPVDQILWNHPNMHSGKDIRGYWKKGHKVRVKVGDFAEVGYGIECKKIGLDRLLEIEKNKRGYISRGKLCPDRRYNISGEKVIHIDEHSNELPKEVRGHFIHYTHICHALGCPHAPIDWLTLKIQRYKSSPKTT